MNSIRVITGPTASGKTEFALDLARHDESIEIVNADASLVYIGFDIGTAKPSHQIRSEVPHHLIDILQPKQEFSAADYSRVARTIIREIIGHGKTPLVVGGTAFYIDALFRGLIAIDATEEAISEGKLRAESEILSEGFEARLNKLAAIDPILHSQILRERNPIRLQRAWEHYYATGEPLGESRKRLADPFEYSPAYTVLEIPREVLWRRIEARTDAMLAAGWLDEVRDLLGSGVTDDMPAMKAIGYRELAEVVQAQSDIKEARDRIIFRTRQYAKRQVTWMRRFKNADPSRSNEDGGKG